VTNSRGSYSAQTYTEKDSVVFSVRVKVSDLASIVEFCITNGFVPKSGGQAAAQAIAMFAESIVSHARAKRYSMNDAKVFLERTGIAMGSKRNLRIIGSQVEPFTPESLTPDQIKHAITEMEKFKYSQQDVTVPANAECILQEMEKGLPNVAESE
jgi:hypothetical protein